MRNIDLTIGEIMINNIRQQAIVGKGGHIEMFSPELPIGARVEIIVSIEVSPLETAQNLLKPNYSQLTLRQGVFGSQLLAFAGCIEPSELQKMSQAIEDDCAKGDLNEWSIFIGY
jgi:hypothetical protein